MAHSLVQPDPLTFGKNSVRMINNNNCVCKSILWHAHTQSTCSNLIIISVYDGLAQPLVVAWQKNKSCQARHSLTVPLLQALSDRTTVWLSHWKINKLLVAYPLPHHLCSPLLSECRHLNLHDHHFAIVLLTSRVDALSRYYR